MSLSENREFWHDFILSYKRLPCLWDPRHEDYNKKAKRNEAYDELIEKAREQYPDANREFVYKKIHALRCNFRREQRNILQSVLKGHGQRKPTLWYYEQLSFIADTVPVKPKLEEASVKIYKVAPSSRNKRKLFEEFVGNVEVDEDEDDDDVVRDMSHCSSPDLDAVKKEAPDSPHSDIADCVELVEETPQSSSDLWTSMRNHVDDFDVAGRKFGNDLRGLDFEQRIIVEKLVSDALFYARLGRLKRSSCIMNINNN